MITILWVLLNIINLLLFMFVKHIDDLNQKKNISSNSVQYKLPSIQKNVCLVKKIVLYIYILEHKLIC